MSVLLVCPSCQNPHTLLRLPVSPECAKCGTPYPEAAYELAVQTLRAEAVPRPTLLTLGMVFSAFWSGLALLITVTTLFSSGGSYTINEQPVSREEFLSNPFVRLFPLVILYMGTVAFGLYRELAWVRPLMLAVWIAYALGIGFLDWPGTSERVLGVGMALVLVAIAGWYLYAKQNVVAYFERIENGAGARTA